MYTPEKYLTNPSQVPVISRIGSSDIYIGAMSGDILVYSVEGDHSMKPSIAAHCLAVNSIAMPKSESFIVSTSTDGKCVVSDPKAHAVVREIPCESLVFPRCAISPDGNVIAVVGNGGQLIIDRHSELTAPVSLTEEPLHCVGFYKEDCSELICASRHSIIEWDIQASRAVASISTKSEMKHSVHCLATYPGSAAFVVGTCDGFILFYDCASGINQISELITGTKLVESLEFSSDGKIIIAATSNSSVLVIDAQKREVSQTIDLKASCILNASLSPEGRTIVSVSENKTTRLSKLA